MPNGVTIFNADRVQHFYTAADQVNGTFPFSGNVDPSASSTAFSLAADADGNGSVIITPAGLIAQSFFPVHDNDVLTMNQ